MAKITLLTGSLVAFSYATEWFTAWYGGNPDERFVFVNRATGPYAWAFWTMVACNVVVPQLPVAAPRAHEPRRAAADRDPDQRGDVVRALRHHRDLAAPQLSAVELGDVLPDVDRGRHAHRQLRAVLHLLSALHPAAAHDRHVGDQGPGRQRRPPRRASDRQRPGSSSWRRSRTRTPCATPCASCAIAASASTTSTRRIPFTGWTS